MHYECILKKKIGGEMDEAGKETGELNSTCDPLQ